MWGRSIRGRLPRRDEIGLPYAHADPRHILPEHPWVGVPGVDGVTPGSVWVVCVDLLAEVSGSVHLHAPVATYRFDGRAMRSDEILWWTPRRWLGRFAVIPAGTEARVVWVGTTFDWAYEDFHTVIIKFALDDGRTFWVTKYMAVRGDPAPLRWSQIACLATIVPADHPLASDRAAAEALVARIGRLARGEEEEASVTPA